jgi:hypothetical protein
MEGQVDRRVFFGSVVAGLPLLAAEGSRMFAQSSSRFGAAAAAHQHDAVVEGSLGSASQAAIARTRDPINDELQRQMKLLMPQIRKGHHAAARQVAGLMRISSVQAAQTLDVQLDQHLRQAINQYGKSNFLINHTASHESMKKELAEYGVSPNQLPFTTYATKERVLDGLLASGLSAYLLKVADAMEMAAAHMEARGPLVAVVFSQAPDETSQKCQEALGHLQAAEAAAAVACGLATLFPNPITAAACAFALGALSGVLVAYILNCLF